MVERRQSFRTQTNRSAVISLDSGERIDCTVRDISVGGAQLEMAERRRLPEKFSLTVVGNWHKRPCRLAWRKDRWLGVEYL
jgi:hypothetical protein